ncbi:MAG: hypothetical protein KC464_06475 [Myxococcales bacterium]|nr:hypothetical protein [Myxococcales bacterium]
MLSRLIAVFFVLWVWPGTGEAAEFVGHWIEDGDAVHGPAHHEQGPTDEDGCPGTSHLCHLSWCSCWSTTQPVLTKLPAPGLGPTRRLSTPPPVARRGCEDPLPLIRPPIS